MVAEQLLGIAYPFHGENNPDNAVSVTSDVEGSLLPRYQHVADLLRARDLGNYWVRRAEQQNDEYGRPLREGRVAIVREGQKDWDRFWRVIRVANVTAMNLKSAGSTDDLIHKGVEDAISFEIQAMRATEDINLKIASGGFR